jgi:ubiquinone/menaquinone biosynthesis C-methylase UbiE
MLTLVYDVNPYFICLPKEATMTNDANQIDHVTENRAFWDSMATDWISAGERSWKQDWPTWGIWAIPESRLKLLPGDMSAMKAVELGCGTGYVSAWMARRGAEVVGIDNSAQQLGTARRLQQQYQVELSLTQGNAEQTPYPDESFDFAISEYGAAIWCDPRLWIPEAWRLLKPGGVLTFLGSHPLALITIPPSGDISEERLHRPYFGIHTFDWRNTEIDPGGVEFNLTHSDWLRLFRETGFDVMNYMELQAPANISGTKFSTSASWGQQWPSEQVWTLRKHAPV